MAACPWQLPLRSPCHPLSPHCPGLASLASLQPHPRHACHPCGRLDSPAAQTPAELARPAALKPGSFWWGREDRTDAPGGAVGAGVSFAFGNRWASGPCLAPLHPRGVSSLLLPPDVPWGPYRCQQGDGHANGAALKSFSVKGPDRDSVGKGVGSSQQPGPGCLAKTTLGLP